MIARLLLSPSVEKIKDEIQKTLASHIPSGNITHPDILYFETGSKLGIAEARKIKNHFSLKPFSSKGRAVIVESAEVLTIEAQNALLKTLEELPEEALLVLGSSTDANFLPTVLSRCEIKYLESTGDNSKDSTKFSKDLEKLLDSPLNERFEYIEKLKNKEEFLHIITYFFKQKMIEATTHTRPGLKGWILQFLQEVLQAEKLAKQNVNIRAILEYLMLKMPSSDKIR